MRLDSASDGSADRFYGADSSDTVRLWFPWQCSMASCFSAFVCSGCSSGTVKRVEAAVVQ